jgi:hypothetical protein
MTHTRPAEVLFGLEQLSCMLHLLEQDLLGPL